MKRVFIVAVIMYLISCGTNNINNNISDSNNSSNRDSIFLNYENIPEERATVSTDAVKSYTETINSFATTDEFKVTLFETKETFRYLIKIQYKSLDEEDTLRIPNFGVQPSVDIKPGKARPSCIVGFYDGKNQFRESKLIYFEDDKLKVRVLKHYAVATYRENVK